MITYSETKDKLDKVGCGFCLAKWTQVTLHLANGMTHSCHHPSIHKVPLNELKNNPSALHNTKFKKFKRKEMLDGKRPEECNYCWNIEDNSKTFSDRVFKSNEPWSDPYYEKIRNSYWRDDFNPTYVEVSFSNTCNFKCAYCGPQYSSKWVEEIEKHGPYKKVDNFNDISAFKEKNQMPYGVREHNPYVEAFWKWWPDLFKTLHTFRITGGEPLLSKDTWKVLDYIKDNHEQNSNLSLSINSNLGVSDELIDRLIKVSEDLTSNNKVRELIIFTSIEGDGSQAEYTRFGLDTERFWNNVEKILKKLPKVTINIMATFNVTSIYTYETLVDKVFDFKVKYANKDRYWGSAIQLDTSYLRHPSHLSVRLAPEKDKKLILKSAEKALYYGISTPQKSFIGFSEVEVLKIKRIYDYAISATNDSLTRDVVKFTSFVDELDKRRGTNFLKTFPQLKELYGKGKNKHLDS